MRELLFAGGVAQITGTPCSHLLDKMSLVSFLALFAAFFSLAVFAGFFFSSRRVFCSLLIAVRAPGGGFQVGCLADRG
jgi:hypothetical protein